MQYISLKAMWQCLLILYILGKSPWRSQFQWRTQWRCWSENECYFMVCDMKTIKDLDSTQINVSLPRQKPATRVVKSQSVSEHSPGGSTVHIYNNNNGLDPPAASDEESHIILLQTLYISVSYLRPKPTRRHWWNSSSFCNATNS